MLKIRPAESRGGGHYNWLYTRHTFSFADYHDPQWMGFRALRVLNDDRVAPGRGFDTHPHRDMEIVTVVLDGELAHQDSLGNGSTIRPGEVQRMTAGTGVTHSERNPSPDKPVHLLQIWLLPEVRGLPPSYEQRAFSDAERQNRLCLLASPDGALGSVLIHQDARLYGATLSAGASLSADIAASRHLWLHIAKGVVVVNGERLAEGDALYGPGAALTLTNQSDAQAEVLLFDLA